MARSNILWLLLCLMFPLEASADTTIHHRTVTTEQYRLTYWTSEQGLPQNTVTCLLQSHNGYLWIGTRYGLARYDGTQFYDYSAELSDSDDGDLDVRGLAQDALGRLWLHTRRGLVSYFEGRFTRHSLADAPFTGPVLRICTGRAGGLWVAKRDGIFHFTEGRVGRSFSLGALAGNDRANQEDINALIEDQEGNLWVQLGTPVSSRWIRINELVGTVQTLADLVGEELTHVGGFWPERSGRLWLARPGELICCENKRLSRYATTNAWQDKAVKALVQDARGSLWAVTEGSVQLHRFENGQFTSFGRGEGLLNTDDVRCLLPDREGNVWIGTGSGGLFRAQPRQLVSLLTGSEAASGEVYSVAVGREGRVWLSTTYGLVKFQEGQFTVYTNAKALPPRDQLLRVRPAFEHSSGQVFFGLDFEGIKTLHDGTFAPVSGVDVSGPVRRAITSLCEDAKGTLWIASHRGLVEWRPPGCRLWTAADGLSDNSTFGLASAPDGGLWVGTLNGGVNELKAGCFRVYTMRDGLLSQNAWPLRAEADGSVWVGTPVGLNRIRGGEIRAVTMREGLFENLAYCLLEDRRSNYWTFGNRGICRIKKEELHAVADGRASRVHCVTYGEADGMASTEGNGDQQPNATALPNGELWFPTTRGVVILDPERLRDNQVRPPVVIEEVRVDDQTVYKNGGYFISKGLVKTAAEPLRLPPGRARVVEVHYTANTFIDSEKTRFRYRLEGDREDWHEADTRRVALFTNLRPGDYRFRVEACNHHGYWSGTPAEFAFHLAPHFYQTWVFYLFCGMVGAVAVGTWHITRLGATRRVLRLKQERALQDERGRIAKDLHDDLGANLTGIALQVEVARRKLDKPVALQQHLQDVAESIRGLVDRMREVVWSLNPECDTLESFCTYLCHYADHFLVAAGLRCRLDFPEEMPARILSAETRHHLLLVVKEALNNATKYAAATEVRLGLKLESNRLTLSIADNGRGFAPDKASATQDSGTTECSRIANKSGRGLSNMRRRVESLGGSFELASEPGLGTRITVQIPLPNA